MPKEVIKKVGKFPLGVNRGEDRYLWGKIALFYDVIFLNKQTALYRIVDEGLTKLKVYDTEWIFDKYINGLNKEKIDSITLKEVNTYIEARKLNFVIPLIRNKEYRRGMEILISNLNNKELYKKRLNIIIRLILRRW